MTRYEAMQKIWPIWADFDVKLLVVALPPTNDGRGNIYEPDSFASSVLDVKFDHSLAFDVLGCRISPIYGPVVTAQCKLERLFSIDGLGNLHPKTNAVCASINAVNLIEANGVTYADKVTIKGFNFGGSCHPSSHYVVPEAPHISALLQYQKAPKLNHYTGSGSSWDATNLDDLAKKMIIDFMTPDEGQDLFPFENWGLNGAIDSLVKRLPCEATTSFYNTLGGLREWAAEPLKMMRRNALQKGDVLYESIRTREILSAASKTIVQREASSKGTTVDQSLQRQEVEGPKAAS
jgi:hypothetical protein